MKPRIFISAVSEEFATLRDQHVDPLLRKLGYEPIAMKVFPTGDCDLRQFLRDRIDSCEGLVQLVGAGYGREPPSIDPDSDRVSYTQFEFYYARLKGKRHWVFTASDGKGVQRDKPVAELDMPPAGITVADIHAYQAERRALQAAYREKLRSEGQLRHPFDSTDKLENLLHGIKDELQELYRQWAELRIQMREVVADTAMTRIRAGRLLGATSVLALLVITVGLAAAPQSSCRLPGMARVCTWLDLNQPAQDMGEIRLLVESLVRERAQEQGNRPGADGRSPEALRSALEDIVQTREGQDALKQFQQGEEAAALRKLDRLRAAQARSVANLALTALDRGKISVRDAVARYEELVRLDPEARRDRIQLAQLLLLLGDLRRARLVAEETLALAERRMQTNSSSAEATRDVIISQNYVGQVKAAQGDAAGTLAAYQRSLEIAEALALTNPSSSLAKRDVAGSLNFVGQIKAAQGDTLGALAAYQRMLEITEALAMADSSSAHAQRDVSLSYANVGWIKAVQGDSTGALTAYQRSLEIREVLAIADPSSAQAKRDVSVGLNDVGQIKATQGDSAGALAAYQRSLEIREALALTDPSNSQAKRDVALSLLSVGQIRADQGDSAGALAVYQRSLEIFQALTLANPSSAQAKLDVSLSLDQIGWIKETQGDSASALANYQRSLDIRDVLARADPSSTKATHDVSVSLDNVGRIKATQGDAVGALAAYQRSLEIREVLALADPSSAQAKRDVSLSLNYVGQIKATQGDSTGALAAYQRGLEIREALALADPSNVQAKLDLMAGHLKLWQLVTERTTQIFHAREADRIISELETHGAHISPQYRAAWDSIRQWLKDHP
jgi:tetratricopeptide (TPR) repeat protein